MKLDMDAQHCVHQHGATPVISTLTRWRQDVLKAKVILGCRMSLRPVWITRDPVF